jgi:hypothetical protein
MARVADTHRERAVGVLARAYSEGRLDLSELERRTTRALGARSTTELRFQLRGLLLDNVRRRARRGAHVAAAIAVWLFASLFLLAAFVGALVATHAAPWTVVFPLCWVLVTALAVRDVRRG